MRSEAIVRIKLHWRWNLSWKLDFSDSLSNDTVTNAFRNAIANIDASDNANTVTNAFRNGIANIDASDNANTNAFRNTIANKPSINPPISTIRHEHQHEHKHKHKHERWVQRDCGYNIDGVFCASFSELVDSECRQCGDAERASACRCRDHEPVSLAIWRSCS